MEKKSKYIIREVPPEHTDFSYYFDDDGLTAAGGDYCYYLFYVIEVDENGKEVDTCGGYIIADCQARNDEEYKRLVCEWACIPEEETRLELMDE